MNILHSFLEFFGIGKKRVFVSHDHSEDAHYRNLLLAWDANSSFEFEFDIRSPVSAIRGKAVSRLKEELHERISQANYLIVIVGRYTYKSKWVLWEIARAKEEGLKIVAIKIDRSYQLPRNLYNSGVKFVNSFRHESILNALREA